MTVPVDGVDAKTLETRGKLVTMVERAGGGALEWLSRVLGGGGLGVLSKVLETRQLLTLVTIELLCGVGEAPDTECPWESLARPPRQAAPDTK